ncbi:PTS glucose transporter subunit IIA [Paenibacillus sp. S02]|uniref:PTS sugar transporter subunit IIA n=1 Tax=Paenibacillus sp. S02 TaxID=2823904 RepID=UPI001C6523A3|nr:PTS glucose transporter subunit IIA [Paenibacillus sp. S02]QYK67472.1 phosphoenolpyruvate-dependent sugar phosphotransferase system, EIIA 1 [Paenibacillus sp. S02]
MFGFKKKKIESPSIDISSPLSGQFLALNEVQDEAFSSKAMGEGFAILPDSGKVIAPFDGIIAHIMEKSKHAILIEHKNGVQLLIHVGMNTVSLKGKGFTAHVSNSDRVKKGQLLLEFDMETLRENGCSTVTPIVVPGGQDTFSRVEVVSESKQPENETVLRIFY